MYTNMDSEDCHETTGSTPRWGFALDANVNLVSGDQTSFYSYHLNSRHFLFPPHLIPSRLFSRWVWMGEKALHASLQCRTFGHIF
jgi:hypothetical protein